MFPVLILSGLLTVIIDHDTIFNLDNPPNPEESYSVVGDATLTFEAGTISALELQDNANLVVTGGCLDGRVSLTGNHDIQLLSGKHQDYMIAHNGYPGGPVYANIYVAPEFGLSTWFSFKGGHQEIVVDGFTYFDGQPRIFGPNVHATLYADDPFYHSTGDGILTGSYCDPRTCSALYVYYDVTWEIYDNENNPPGDSNGDGSVNIADLNAVRNNFGRLLHGTNLEQGDTFPLDGNVDVVDLNRVRNNFGAASPVPEPGTMPLLVSVLLGMGSLFLSRRSVRFISFASLSFLALLTLCQNAEASSLFWTVSAGSKATIARSNLNGTLETDLFVDVTRPTDIAIDPATGDVFWSTDNAIYSGKQDGSQSHVVSQIGGNSIAVDTSLGYAFIGGNPMRRVSLNGGEATDIVATGGHSIHLDAPNRRVYYWDYANYRIRRSGLDGALATTIVPQVPSFRDLDVDVENGHVYFATSGRLIERANIDGSGGRVEIVNLPVDSQIRRIALDVENEHIYWTNSNSDRIQRADLSGANVVDIVLGLNDPYAIELGRSVLPVLGDTNSDGVVNVADLNNVRNNFGGTGLGDTNHDDKVDVSDLNNVRNNFGARSAAASVPEPSTGLLLGFLVGACLVGIRNRRFRLYTDS